MSGSEVLRRHRRLLALVSAILIAGALCAWLLYARADRYMRDELLDKTSLVAGAVRIERIEALAGTEADLDVPEYQALKHQLVAVRASDPQYRFVYLMGRRVDGTAFFYADSEPEDSPDYSPPGEEYHEASSEVRQAFDTRTAVVEGPVADRWGEWVSAFVPLTGRDPGDSTVMLGVDIDASEWIWGVMARSVLPVGLATLALLAAALAGSALLTRRARHEGRPPRSLEYVEVGAAAVVGLVLTACLAWFVAVQAQRDQVRSFYDVAASRTALLDYEFRDVWSLELEGLAGLYEGSEYVTVDEFQRYAEYLSQGKTVKAWEWAPAVPASEKDSLETQARVEGIQGFQIWQMDATGNRVPAQGRDIYYPVLRVAPREGNQAALGFDLGSDAIRRTAIEEALRTGQTTATEPVMLVQESGDKKGMLICRPVHTAVSQEDSRPSGLVLAALSLDEALSAARPDAVVAMELLHVHGDGSSESLARSWTEDDKPDSSITVRRPVLAFGKAFVVVATAGPAFDSISPLVAGLSTASAGLLLTIATAVVVWLVRRRRQALEGMVREGTSALRETEERYRRILEVAPVGIAVHQDGKIVFANPAALQLLGAFSHDDLVGKEIASIIDRGALESTAGRAHHPPAGEQGLHPAESRFVRLDGSVIDVEVLASDLTYQGKPAIQVIVTDVTERKRSEEARIQKEAELQKVTRAIEQAVEAVVITDVAGAIQYVNPAFEVITGYTRGEVLGQNPRLLSSGLQDRALYQKLWEAISSGQTWEGRMINKRKDGALYTEESTIAPVKDSAGQILNYVAVKRDITENLRLGEEKAELQEQLLQSQKLESIGRLAGGVAHDFNNMLGVIIGYGETILDRLHDGDPLRDDVQQIVQAGGRSAALVGQLLAFSRRQNLKPTVLEPNEVIRYLEPMLRRLSGEAVDMELILAKDSGRVLADRSQIEQVVMNLVVNARDAMPEGGRLLIETAPVELDAAYVRKHPVVTPGRYVLLSVTDTGLGMDRETLRQVFDPFFTTKGRDGGTGLGLATVYGIVKQSGGSIWAYSEPGHGTTFKVYLPRTDAAQEDSPIAQEAARTRGGSEKILVVEDEESLRRLMASILSPLGYQVTMAADGEEALRLVEEQGLQPDLVITDVIMPRMSGSQLVERLRRDRPDLRVLYMSGYTDNAIVRHGVLEADVSFLQKPFSVREVALKVREVLLG